MSAIHTRLLLLAIYLAAVVTSVTYAEARHDALGFHTRDYAFYYQFATKLLDGEIQPKSYSINPDGYNFLFFNGTDGAESFHQSVHLEPVKYVYPVLYATTHDARTVFWFVAVMLFLPILYLAAAGPLAAPEDRSFAIFFAALYVLYPSSLKAASYDLRPFVFLAPFFAVAMLAVMFSRSVVVIALSFAAMFLAREEALIFGTIVIAYAFITLPEGSFRKRTVVWLSAIWIAWLLAALGFFLWTGYPNTLTPRLVRGVALVSARPSVTLGLAVASVLAVVLAAGPVSRRLTRAAYSRIAPLAIYSVVFPILGFQFVRERSEALVGMNGLGIARVVLSPRFALHLATLLVFLAIAWRIATTRAQRLTILALLVAGTVVSGVITFGSEFGVPAQLQSYGRDAVLAGDVLALRQTTNKYSTRVLTDYATHQAFADYEYVYLYSRLPWGLVPGQKRYYPDNRAVVQDLIDNQIEYIVIAKSSVPDVSGFLEKHRVLTATVFENPRFIALRLERATASH